MSQAQFGPATSPLRLADMDAVPIFLYQLTYVLSVL
jgi:hypothetical protein